MYNLIVAYQEGICKERYRTPLPFQVPEFVEARKQFFGGRAGGGALGDKGRDPHGPLSALVGIASIGRWIGTRRQ